MNTPALSGCGTAAIFPIAGFVAAGGYKLPFRERDLGEQFTGVFCAAGVVAALLGGDAVVQHRDYQLGIPLQPNNGELPQCYQQPPLLTAENQFLIKAAANPLGDLLDGLFPGTFAHIHHFGTEHHGV